MIGQNKIKKNEDNIAGMKEAGYNIKLPDPIGMLKHKPTRTSISVYKPISRFKALMLKWCFGLEYKRFK